MCDWIRYGQTSCYYLILFFFIECTMNYEVNTNICNICFLTIEPVYLVNCCILCQNNYHLKCLKCMSSHNTEECWLCHQCVRLNLPFPEWDNSTAKDFLKRQNMIESLSVTYLDPIDHSDEGRMLLNDEGLDADLNCLDSSSEFSSMHTDLHQLYNFSKSLNHLNQFSIAHLNCRGMNNKSNEIFMLLTQSNFSVLALTETWLNDDQASSIKIPGYHFIHRSRRIGIRGGVGFLIKMDIEFGVMDDIPRTIGNTFDRAEPILGSATRFSRVSSTRQYSVFGRHRPAKTEY